MLTGLSLLVIPFVAQGALMFVDEFLFHWRRGLGWWERLGHPLDTISVLVCLLIAAFAPFTFVSFQFFLVAALVSCVLVTKDEFVHSKECNWLENWIHSLLFILHPIVLGAAFLLWLCRSGYELGAGEPATEAGQALVAIWSLMKVPPWPATFVLYGQCLLVGVFLLYQINHYVIGGRGRRKLPPAAPSALDMPQVDQVPPGSDPVEQTQGQGVATSSK
jgi:hypothetical protein